MNETPAFLWSLNEVEHILYKDDSGYQIYFHIATLQHNLGLIPRTCTIMGEISAPFPLGGDDWKRFFDQS